MMANQLPPTLHGVPLSAHHLETDFSNPLKRSKSPSWCRTTQFKRNLSDGWTLLRQRIDRIPGISSCGGEGTSSSVCASSQSNPVDMTFKNGTWPSPDDEIPFWKRDFPVWNPTSHDTVDVPKDSDPMHIIHVTAEMAPIAKVGGLADVVTGLARASMLRGHHVEIMLPLYECIQKHQVTDLKLSVEYKSYHNSDWIHTRAYHGLVSGIPVIFIEPENSFFKGKGVYGGCYNELEAYLFFTRACLEWMQVTGTQSDIIHVHEWQTGALPLLYWDMYHALSIKKPRLVLTIHNMEHYGECRQEQLSLCGLDGSVYATIDKAIDDRTIGHNPERLSLLKGGIVYSNAVVTVSPTYLNETLCSGWLASTLMRNREKYFGILNGIDTAVWNPSTDVYLAAKFSEYAQGKQICKHYVQRGLGLNLELVQVNGHDANRIPLVVCITRLVAQKGLHLIRYALKRVEELGGQMVLLGGTPDNRIRKEFEDLATIHNKGSSIRILLIYSEELSHMLYAAADTVLVPSMYEPCGLAQMIGMRYGAVLSSQNGVTLRDFNYVGTCSEELSHMLYAAADTVLVPSMYEPCGLAQMIGMRYGAIPIVRKTGGLADTVFDLDDQSNLEKANGFLFQGIDEGSLNFALERAFHLYKEKPEFWKDVASRIMQIDNSWNNTAGKYIEVYNSIRVRY